MEQRVVLITGASSGIGIAAARMFAAAGDTVVLSARRQERMEGLRDELKGSGHQALVLTADLAEVSQAESLVGRTVEAAGRIDVLVNNAGYGMQCRFEEMSPAEVGRMFAVNVLSAMALARAAAQEMRHQAVVGRLLNRGGGELESSAPLKARRSVHVVHARRLGNRDPVCRPEGRPTEGRLWISSCFVSGRSTWPPCVPRCGCSP